MISVSYTHLGHVGVRQDGGAGPEGPDPGLHRPGGEHQITGVVKVRRGVDGPLHQRRLIRRPVSYTHLDVYKRQQGDFVLCLYNPSSRRRRDHLRMACDIVLAHRGPETVCGWVRNAGRTQEEHQVLTLGAVSYTHLDVYKRQTAA